MKRLLSTNELAAELNRPVRQIRSFVAAKKIPVLKIGWRTNLFDPEKVIKALARFEIPAVNAKNAK
jgi:hypothetical protein